MKVYVHLAEGFEEIEAVTVVDVLRRAGVEAETVSVTGTHLVTGAHGIPVTADLLFEEADYDSCEMIVLPGGMPGTTNLGAHKGLVKQLEKFAEQNRWLAAICAAPMVLGQSGLLKDRTAVIYPGMETHLKGAQVGEKPVEIDGKIITSKGPGTAMAFALTLAEVLKGASEADALKRSMLLDS
jgi:4-methyl-5(b-hydroxyethyl)-thiazole monophosphate biosynthesis